MPKQSVNVGTAAKGTACDPSMLMEMKRRAVIVKEQYAATAGNTVLVSPKDAIHETIKTKGFTNGIVDFRTRGAFKNFLWSL